MFVEISRTKHDAGIPHRAIRACLEFAKVRPDRFDFKLLDLEK